jgi:hypothetical protein
MRSAAPVIELGSSRAIVSYDDMSIRLELSAADVANQVVWGRFLLEKALLMLTLRSERHYALHGGGLSIGDRAAVVTAPGGVGKSTFLANALRRGARFIADDALVRHLDDPEPRFWGYERAAHVSPSILQGWSELTEAIADPVPGRDKLRVEWPTRLRDCLRSCMWPTAFLFLTRAHTEVRALSVDEGLSLCREDYLTGKQTRKVSSVREDAPQHAVAGRAMDPAPSVAV